MFTTVIILRGDGFLLIEVSLSILKKRIHECLNSVFDIIYFYATFVPFEIGITSEGGARNKNISFILFQCQNWRSVVVIERGKGQLI